MKIKYNFCEIIYEWNRESYNINKIDFLVDKGYSFRFYRRIEGRCRRKVWRYNKKVKNNCKNFIVNLFINKYKIVGNVDNFFRI